MPRVSPENLTNDLLFKCPTFNFFSIRFRLFLFGEYVWPTCENPPVRMPFSPLLNQNYIDVFVPFNVFIQNTGSVIAVESN